MNKKRWFLFVGLLAVGVIEMAVIWWRLERSTTNDSVRPSQDSNQVSSDSFDKKQYSTDQTSSIWAVVNKGRVLPSSYVPANLTVPNVALRYSRSATEMKLRSDAAQALEVLFADAANDNIYLRLASGYRSFNSQSGIYAREVRTYGQVEADRQSARPGHSEHQTGLAADIEPSDRRCEIDVCFADTAEGKWLAANAHIYSFIIRYPAGKESQTGYKYEPWHIRYVGTDLATEIQKAGQTIEQFFDLPIYTDYPTKSYQLR